MSKYTTEVRKICENYAGSGFTRVDDIINRSLPIIFDFDFPIYDENYRAILERKIIKHFYMREIGLETVELWKLFLNQKLNEIMPYYNELYISAQMIVDPLEDVDYLRTESREGKGTANVIGNNTNTTNNTETQNGTNGRNATHWQTYQDTPQGALSGVQAENYLTTAQKDTDNETGTNSNTTVNNGSARGSQSTNGTTTDESEATIRMRGKLGVRSKSKLLQEYRDTILNIDMMIIRDLEELFMQLW